MLFRTPPLKYLGRNHRPSVLALYSDDFIGEVRLKPMLNALLNRNVIDNYQIADREMKLVGPLKTYGFTHIWCQRNVSTNQFHFLKRHVDVPIIYDIDDLLTSAPEFVSYTRQRTIKRIEWCIHHATVVTVATDQLAANLREDVPGFSQPLIVLKNGCIAAPASRDIALMRRLVWASNDRPFVLKSNPDFFNRLAQIANRSGYEAVFIGRFDSAHLALFDRPRHLPYLDFGSYRQFLGACAGAIGLAPLPSDLPAASQRFFDAKSDIKLVDFHSSHMVPVCTSATPYATSELLFAPLAAPDPSAFLDTLERCMAEHEAMIARVDAAIHQTGRLKAREYGRISQAMDPFFA